MIPVSNPTNSVADDDVEGCAGARVRQHVHLQAVAAHADGGSYSGRGEIVIKLQRFSSTCSPCFVIFLCVSCDGLLGQ